MRKINIFLENCNESIWLIESNFVWGMRFYKDKEYSDKSTAYIFIEEGIIMGIHGENLHSWKLKIVFGEARLLWQKLLTEGWQKTNSKW